MITTSRCRPGEILKVTTNETEYLMSDSYPALQRAKLACSWQLLTDNSTGVLVTVVEGGSFLSTDDTEQGAKTVQQVETKVLHLPADSIISWSGGASNGKFLATIQSLGKIKKIRSKIRKISLLHFYKQLAPNQVNRILKR